MTEWGSPSDETGKTEASCHSTCGTIKIPPWSKALSIDLNLQPFTGNSDVSINVKNSRARRKTENKQKLQQNLPILDFEVWDPVLYYLYATPFEQWKVNDLLKLRKIYNYVEMESTIHVIISCFPLISLKFGMLSLSILLILQNKGTIISGIGKHPRRSARSYTDHYPDRDLPIDPKMVASKSVIYIQC
jgi:hypothetical protein